MFCDQKFFNQMTNMPKARASKAQREKSTREKHI
jgi:hypothetical protein